MSTLSEPRRPRLLPQNRKLRHLKGLSLRNLSFAQAPAQTADDASLNATPNKLEALKESGGLPSSHSPESLCRDGVRPDLSGQQWTRRTSFSLAQASPVTRQKRLDALVDSLVADVFFSLHTSGFDEPVYISEVRERATNFNFQFFDLSEHAACVSRSCCVTIRLWARRPKTSSWIFLLEEVIDLRQLRFIGSLVDRRFPPNALIVHLEDGIYSLDFPSKESAPRQAPPVASSTYNALMRLANLETSIRDALETQQKIMDQIGEILEEDADIVRPESAEQKVALAHKYVATQQRTNRLAEKRRDELRASLRNRRDAMAQGRALQAKAEEDMTDNAEKLKASKKLLEQTQQQIHGQRRRICSELADIFPIVPVPNSPPLSFRICNIPLPNSVYDAATARSLNEDVLSAGLGLVALLAHHLQFYLSRPLPYPLAPYGSRSSARDTISRLQASSSSSSARRDFPLHLPRGGSTAGQWRFEYGWFLLNKDLEALCASQGLRVVDIRHTLPNLKYLLYVCSAGTDEVPARKKGGVRGLWAGRLRDRISAVPSMADGETSSFGGSRRASTDGLHVHDGSHDTMIHHHHNNNNSSDANGVAASPTRQQSEEASLPFDAGEAKFTLRTRGLREDVAQ